MARHHYAPPPARRSVMDPELIRPEWTSGVPRNPDLLWLDKNENTDPQLMAVISPVFGEVAATALNSYPEMAPFYHKLGGFLGVGPDHLLLTPGSDGAIRAVFEAYINPGDVVVHTLPTFAMYAVYARMYGARTVRAEYQPSPRGPSLPAESVVSTVLEVRPKLVCLPNPDSPTGSVFGEAALRRIVEAAGDAGSLILVDEAYYPFYEHTVLPWLGECPHLVIARSCSKAWGLAGLRAGYAIASPAVAALLHKVRPSYEVNSLAVALMERMLDLNEQMLASVQRLNAGRDAFIAAMESLGLRTIHAKGNFMHVAFGPWAPAVHRALEGLVLYRRDFAHPCLQGFSRFSATTIERFQPIVECIQATVGGPQRGNAS